VSALDAGVGSNFYGQEVSQQVQAGLRTPAVVITEGWSASVGAPPVKFRFDR
jgi:hypothetical protein